MMTMTRGAPDTLTTRTPALHEAGRRLPRRGGRTQAKLGLAGRLLGLRSAHAHSCQTANAEKPDFSGRSGYTKY